MEEAKNPTQKVNVSTEGPSVYTIKVIPNSQNASELQHPRYRGKDKKPRKTNVNSLRNLKPFQSISDLNKLEQYTRDYSSKPSLSWKFWIVLLIIFGIIIFVYLIWRHYKEKREQSYNSDNSSDIFDSVTK